MTTKKRAILALVPILLLAGGVYLGVQFIAGLWWSVQAKPLPAVTLDAMYPGASASVIADCLAAPIEQQVNGVEGMVSLHSRCGSDGSYSLSVTFKPGTDLRIAQALVQNRVQLAMPILPAEVQRDGLTVKEQSPGIALIVNLSSPDGSRDSVFLSNYAVIEVRDELTRLSGVSDILLVGRSDWRTRIDLDVPQLAARELTVNAVVEAIRQQPPQIQVAAGPIGIPPPRLLNVDQARDIILKVGPDAHITRLKDVARLETGGVSRNTAHFNGSPVASLFVYPLPQANLRDLRSAIKERLAQLRARLPAGLSVDVAFDFTTNLRRTPSFDHLWLDVNLPVNVAPERRLEVLHRSEKILKSMEPVWDVLEMSGPPFAPFDDQGCILIRLESAARSEADRAEIMKAIRGRLAKEIPEAKIRLRDLSGTGRLPPGNYPVSLAIQGPDQDKVRAFAAKLVERLSQSPKLIDVCVNPESEPSAQLFADIDRNKMAELGVPLEEVNVTLAVWFGSARIDGFDNIDVRCCTGILDFPARVAEMKRVKVRSNAGKLVPLEALVKLSEVRSARLVHRLDCLPIEEITANPAPGVSLAEARSSCASLAEVVRRELRLAQEYRLIWP